MKTLFLMDPIEAVRVTTDTTFALMMAAQARGHEVYYATVEGLVGMGGASYVFASKVELRAVQGDHFSLADEERLPLDAFEVIWMRTDPPVDRKFLGATWLLDFAHDAGVQVINNPYSLRDCNEKAVILRFPELTPETAIATRKAEIDRLAEEWGGAAVLKPLDGLGGRGIFLWKLDDPNRGAIWEVSTGSGDRAMMVQAFLPEYKSGDKRILLMDGEPVAAILRVPIAGELRGNLAAGGSAVETSIDADDQRIIDGLRPYLRKKGLRFVGVDVIGGKMTELNVTSPTGIQEASRFSGEDLAAKVIARAESGAWR